MYVCLHPVAEGTPEKQSLAKVLDLRKNRGTGRRKAGYDLEQGVNKPGNLPGDDKGQTAGKTENNPAHRDTDHAVGGVKVALCSPAKKAQQDGNHQQQHDGQDKGLCRGALPVSQADKHGRKHEEPFQKQDLGDKPPHHSIIQNLFRKEGFVHPHLHAVWKFFFPDGHSRHDGLLCPPYLLLYQS